MAITMMFFPLFFILQIIVAHIVVFTNFLTEDIKIKCKAIWFCLPTILFIGLMKFYIYKWKNPNSSKTVLFTK